jgi:Mlc titration factor MtfA (ptsG expression regulator)
MVFSPLKKNRRRRLLATPIPHEWVTYLRGNVALYESLTDLEQERLRNDLRVFIAEKNWEGCAGLTITDEIRVTIAAQACLLLLGVEHDYFSRVLSVLVYPATYRDPREHINRDGLLEEDRTGRVGEAWYRGPVVLAWDSVVKDARDPAVGRNVVLHEFAHQLDFLDGLANGTPALKNQAQRIEWHGVMTAAYEELIQDSETGGVTFLDQYGATNPCEFFAVATEAFFTLPNQLQRRHPLLYKVLSEYYGQHPAARIPRQEQ